MAEQANSEPAYYTWVDAQGVVHNTPIQTKLPSKKNINRSSQAESVAEKNADASINIDDFLSEEDNQARIKKEKEDKKPFFTWTDAQGIIRSELKPDVLVDFVAEEIVYDAVFAPPFRLPEYVMEGECCENYSDAFTAVVKLNGSVGYKVDDTLFPFQTQTGDVAAGYFSLPELLSREILLLKGYKLPLGSTFEIVALDKAYKPLHLASELEGIAVEQTWKDVAYIKVMLEISDPDVSFLVVFVRSNNQKALTDYRLSVMRDQLLD